MKQNEGSLFAQLMIFFMYPIKPFCWCFKGVLEIVTT